MLQPMTGPVPSHVRELEGLEDFVILTQKPIFLEGGVNLGLVQEKFPSSLQAAVTALSAAAKPIIENTHFGNPSTISAYAHLDYDALLVSEASLLGKLKADLAIVSHPRSIATVTLPHEHVDALARDILHRATLFAQTWAPRIEVQPVEDSLVRDNKQLLSMWRTLNRTNRLIVVELSVTADNLFQPVIPFLTYGNNDEPRVQMVTNYAGAGMLWLPNDMIVDREKMNPHQPQRIEHKPEGVYGELPVGGTALYRDDRPHGLVTFQPIAPVKPGTAPSIYLQLSRLERRPYN